MNKKAKATANRSKRNGNVILGLCKPMTGGKYKGWTLCECTRSTLRLIGEEELSSLLNGSKSTLSDEIIAACKKGLDLGRALSVGIKLSRDLNYTPCEAIRLYGDGATKLVKRLDSAKAALKVYTDKTVEALKALLKSKESERNALFKTYQSASKAESEHREVYKKAVAQYNKDCADCTKVLTMNQLRKA